MTHPVELFTSSALAILRTTQLSREIEQDVHILPGIYFSWDPEHGKTAVSITSSPWDLCKIYGKVSGGPRWLSFNLSLGKASFNVGDTLGIVIELEGCPGMSLQPFVRSMRNEALEDTPLQDRIEGSEDRAVRTLLHTIAPGDPIAGPTAYHTLVMALPMRDFELHLRDLRLFVVPAARGLRRGPMSLSGAAV